jgi:hypothetical protein
VAVARGVGARFRMICENDPTPGMEYARWNQIQTMFLLSMMLTLGFACAAGYVSSLWARASIESGLFGISSGLGVAAVYDLSGDMAVMLP